MQEIERSKARPSFCCNATHFLKRTSRKRFVYSTSAWNTSSSPIVREQSYAKKKKKIKKTIKGIGTIFGISDYSKLILLKHKSMLLKKLLKVIITF